MGDLIKLKPKSKTPMVDMTLRCFRCSHEWEDSLPLSDSGYYDCAKCGAHKAESKYEFIPDSDIW